MKRAGWITRDRMRVLAALAVGLALAALALGADEPAAPYFRVSGAEAGVDALPLKATAVDVVLAGVIADVRVTQTYRNEGTRPLEAKYIFPGSTRAAVHGLTMTIGERRFEARIQEKAEARKTYETAKREGRAATLLEAQRSNLFEMNVANLLPGETIAVELRYTELLSPADGQYEWVFPTTVGPRYVGGGAATTEGAANASDETAATSAAGRVPEPTFASAATAEPAFTLTAEVVAGAPLGRIECASHRVETDAEGPRARVRLVADEGAAMNRDFILRYRLAGEALRSGLMLDRWRGENFFLLTVQPPAHVTREALPPRDYVFVVDVSGSMGGFPLDTAKQLLTELLLTVREGDSFNVLLFSGDSAALSAEPLAATPENLAKAVRLIQGRSGGGGTELLPALEHALALPRRGGVSRSVVVVTDGYVQVEAEAYALVRARLGEANLFAFGIGPSVNRELIERLARAGRADAAVIEGPARVLGEVAKFRAMIEAPVLTQVRTEFAGFAATDVQPQVQPDVLAQRPLVLVGKWTGAANGRVKLRGFSGGGAWEAEVEVSGAVDLGETGVLAQLWAREKAAALDDLHALNVDPARCKAELIQLGLRYNLLTRFTSFVAVDLTPRVSPPGAADKVEQPLSEPATMGGADGVPTTPEPETVGLVVVAALVAIWGGWRGRARRKSAGETERGSG